MIKYKTQIDQRPFQSRDELAREVALQTQYRSVAIPAVVAALQTWARLDDTVEGGAKDVLTR